MPFPVGRYERGRTIMAGITFSYILARS